MLTRSFKELVQRRVASDTVLGHALLREGIDTRLAGDVDTGKAMLRDYIKATVGFEKLGEATGTSPKSLIRMLDPRGNPQGTQPLRHHRLPAETGRRRAARCDRTGLNGMTMKLGETGANGAIPLMGGMIRKTFPRKLYRLGVVCDGLRN